MKAHLFLLLAAAVTGIQCPAEQVPPEPAPTVPAGQLLPAEIALTGTDYTIDPQVPTDGFAGVFILRTRFGDYECAGREMLFTRLQELKALEEIDRVSKTAVFAKAITKGAVEEPVEAAVKIAKNPIGSLEKAPVGAARLVGKVAGGFASAGKSIGKLATPGGKTAPEGTAKPPPSREDPIGYNEARNEWAAKFGVDPYTTNRPLALKLNHLGMISFSVDKVAGAGSGAVVGGLGPIAEWLSWLPDIDEHLLTRPPRDVAKYNEKRLADLGVPKKSMAALLENGWFSPTLQTRFVNAVARMKDATNCPTAADLAGNVESEEQARFVCESLELLARNIEAVPPPRELRMFGGLAAAAGADGSMVVAAPVDLLSWTDLVEKFASQHDPASGLATLCINGPLTDRARDGFTSVGWRISTGAPAR